MLILGVADNHDAGAAVVEDGVLLAAVGQERIDRNKNSGAFPWGAIEAALDKAERRARDVDRIVFGTSFTPSFLLRKMPELHHGKKANGSQFDYLLNLYITYQVALRQTGLHLFEVEACQRLLAARMRDRGFEKARVDLMDHHQAHAHAAYRSQEEPVCLVLTVDAMGDGQTCTASVGRQGQLDQHWSQSGFAAVNTYYSRVTEWLGFTPNRHEGKITGLAAYTDPPPELLAHFRKQLHFVGPGFSTVNYLERQHEGDAFYGALSAWSKEQIASAMQRNLEHAVTAFVEHWVGATGVADVAVCGGIFANVKLNQRIAELACVDSLWVYPNMGDGGLCVGAALAAAERPPRRLPSLYLGPAYKQSTIAQELNIAGLRPEKPDDLEARVVELLAAGKVVARFDGGMEFGPRALGNRSILFRPDDPSVNDWLNKHLQRTEFMPFAPMLRAERAQDCFVGVEKAANAARFMTVCFDCTPFFLRTCPGVVHCDGTARPQLVHEADNPKLWRLLELWEEHTGLPALINTSFNMHEEPIVCSPHDAIRAWTAASLDALSIGPFLVTPGAG